MTLRAALPPVWLLDVDGVVNAVHPWGADHLGDTYTTGTMTIDGGRYPMTWSPALIDRIRDLHTAGVVEVRWATGWCVWAHHLETLWNLPRLGRAFTTAVVGDALTDAKLAAARWVLAEGRRLVWTDDLDLPAGRTVLRELTWDGRALLIAPDRAVGLLPADMDRIEAFAAKTLKVAR